MERGEIKGSVCVPVLKKFEERRSVGITKRPCNTFRRRHHLERAKKQERTKKEEWTKKRNSSDKTKPDEVKEMVVDAGSKEESLAQPAWEGYSRDKPKAGELNKIVVDAGSKEESMAQPAAEGKMRKKLVTQEVVDFYVGVEIVHYMLCKPLQTVPEDTITEIFLNPEFDVSISALLKESIEENADMLRQYRTNMHTKFPTKEEARRLVREQEKEKTSARMSDRSFMFCDDCGTMLDFNNVKFASCSLCPFKRMAKDFEGKEIRYLNREDIERELNIEPQKKNVIPESSKEVVMQKTEVDRECPECRHPKLQYFQRQLRGVDAAMTTYFSCPDCGHKFNED